MALDMRNMEAALAQFPPQLRQQLQQRMAAQQAHDQGIAKLAQQLGDQAKQYGFSWQGNKPAAFHQGKMAAILYDKGVRNLNDLGYTPDGKNMINKATGQIVPWYKDEKVDAKGKAQIGWESGGKGRTNYYAHRGPGGVPIFAPEWKSNAPKGVGGFVLKAAAPVISAFNPLAGAGVGAVLGLAQGQKFGDIAKGAAINYASGSLGNAAANAATKSLPMLGNATLTNAAADALGGAASGGFGAGVRGQNILQGAARGGAVAGLGSLGYGAYKDLTSTRGEPTGGFEQQSGIEKFGDSLVRAGLNAGLNYAFAPDINASRPTSSSRQQSNSTAYLGPATPATPSAPSVQYGRAAVSPVTTVATQGLGGYNPGDVSTEATGNPRQNVWNEASLRLKDALGV